ncbi:hypothetical protein BAT_0336 [Bacillus pumilus ATCC 7061]|nr:hypothetical protein BAT_0336 [Bacillus pumilus ATCC 7061]
MTIIFSPLFKRSIFNDNSLEELHQLLKHVFSDLAEAKEKRRSHL